MSQPSILGSVGGGLGSVGGGRARAGDQAAAAQHVPSRTRGGLGPAMKASRVSRGSRILFWMVPSSELISGACSGQAPPGGHLWR